MQRAVDSLPSGEPVAAVDLSGGVGCGDCSGGSGGGGSDSLCSRTADRGNQAKDGRDGNKKEARASRSPTDPGTGQRTITEVRFLDFQSVDTPYSGVYFHAVGT